ncbi:MAG: FkbM family methyltransferase [Bacteroidales bacterium]|nr:FkbM family methyltransferase [Bacteroidales bacterium]
MDSIRKILFKILGLKLYLRVISRIYVSLIMKGKLKKEYPEIHYLSAIVREGYVCIDIGANLGYYSSVLSSIVKKTGHVYAVEPIPLFGKIWKKNVKVSRYSNLTLLPYALGLKKKQYKWAYLKEMVLFIME